MFIQKSAETPEKLCQPQGGAGADAAFPYPLVGGIDGISQLTLRYFHRQKEFIKQHLSGMLSGFYASAVVLTKHMKTKQVDICS